MTVDDIERRTESNEDVDEEDALLLGAPVEKVSGSLLIVNLRLTLVSHNKGQSPRA